MKKELHFTEERLKDLGDKILIFGTDNKLDPMELWFFCHLMDRWLRHHFGIDQDIEITETDIQ